MTVFPDGKTAVTIQPLTHRYKALATNSVPQKSDQIIKFWWALTSFRASLFCQNVQNV